MTLTPETGTVFYGVDSFDTLANAKAYWDALGTDYSSYADAALEQAIRRATNFLSESYRWKGTKVRPRGTTGGEQVLAWPRYNATDAGGYSIDYDSVPWEVKRAMFEIAIAEAATPGIMQPTYTASERVKSERVGPISVEYDLSDVSAQSVRPVLLAVRDLIGGLLDDTGGSMIAGTAYRA